MIVIDTRSARELTKKLARLGKDFGKGIKAPRQIQEVLFKSGSNMRNFIITSMQNTTRAPWSYKRGKKRHYPSMPGDFPAIDTGQAARSIAFDNKTDGHSLNLEIGVNGGAPYMEYHETRKDKRKRRPWLNPTIKKFQPEILKELGKIVPNATLNIMIKGSK